MEPDNPDKVETQPPDVPTTAAAPTARPVLPENNVSTVPTTGKRQSVRNIARQLTDDDLGQLGVVKLIIENLDRAELECETLQVYVEKYHQADKNCGIYEERAKTSTAIEVAFAVFVGLGCAIIGLVPSFWDQTSRGPLALGIGILLVVGGIVTRVIKR